MNQIESGTIFKFKLPFDLGAAYCKVVDFSNLSNYYGIITKVYDLFTEENVTSVDAFRDIPLFMNEIPICKMPTLRGKYSWKKIGVLTEEKDSLIPTYKELEHEGFAFDIIEKYQKRD